MERYNVNNHLFYDGYNLDNDLISNPLFVEELLEKVNNIVFEGEGKIKLIPYFNGKIKRDGGISGIILGDNFHFTCHTFSFKNTVFVDCFCDEYMKSNVERIVINTFNTDEYDMGSKDVKGNFGKHVIFKVMPLLVDEVVDLVKLILKEINMTPITETIVNKKDANHFDIIQLIAESHISFHRDGESMVVDVFSCKYFDVEKLLSLFNEPYDVIEVNRGIKYIN